MIRISGFNCETVDTFENLGLYEMVMRRCHSIIVVDCDADSDFHFEDLGNALRRDQD